jgi:hypothetical protein
MLNANPENERPESDAAAVERIAQGGGRGAVVIGTWLAFYLFVFLPRSVAP